LYLRRAELRAFKHLSVREIYLATVAAAGKAAADGNHVRRLERLPLAVLAELDEASSGGVERKAQLH
jgi:hypothetical protein